MIINIQLFGGRGTDSGFGGEMDTGDGKKRVTRFFDKTDKFAGMSIHEFENAIREKSVEYIGLFDKDGNLLVAGTSNNKGAVAIPTNAANFKDAVTLTHNHPNGGKRIIGGSFSDMDVKNHLRLNFKGETRAVANGQNENTYIFRAKAGAKQNREKMMRIARTVGQKYESEAQKTLNKVRKDLSVKGKSLGGKDNQVYIGTAKRLWKKSGLEKAGYEYIEVNKKRW